MVGSPALHHFHSPLEISKFPPRENSKLPDSQISIESNGMWFDLPNELYYYGARRLCPHLESFGGGLVRLEISRGIPP